MNKFLRKNNKKLMAVFAAFLMIAFVAPSISRRGAGGDDAPYGKIGDETIGRGEVAEAKNELALLSESLVYRQPDQAGSTREISLLEASQSFLRFPIINEFREKPELLVLLEHEARQMAATASDQQIESAFAQGLSLKLKDGRQVSLDAAEQTNAPAAREARQAVRNWLSVMNALNRAVGAVKVSEPLLQRQMADAQDIKVRYVQVSAKDFLDKVPAPTTQQLEEQFRKYANASPHISSSDNPYGFGYRYPAMVKLQYIAIPKSEVDRAVRAEKSDYDRDVDARKYYAKNQREFPTTQPLASTTQPTTQFAGPTTMPYEQVREKIIAKMIAPAIEQKMQAVVSEVSNKLHADYDRFAASKSPTTEPAYNTLDYLKQLATDVQKQFGVLPSVASIADSYKQIGELQRLSGIGEASDGMRNFAEYATSFQPPTTMPSTEPSMMAGLRILEPSTVLHDESDTAYIFRLTDGKPQAAPASLGEIESLVKADWKNAAAFEMAKEAAQKIADNARAHDGLNSIDSAATRKVITTDYFQRGGQAVAGVALTGAPQAKFVEDAFKLLSIAKTAKGPAINTVELPDEGQLFVIELASIKPQWNDQNRALFNQYVNMQLRKPFEQAILMQWFSYDSVVKRTGFVSEKASKTAKTG